MQVCEWIYDAEVRPGLWRVFNAHEVKWFVCEADAAAGPGKPVSVLGPDLQSVSGLLIPRCLGGMLEDAVLGLAPMGAEELVCLLRDTVEATGGRTGAVPISRANLALADDGSICALPGVEVSEEESEARELGELLYAAAQGVAFTDSAVPLKNRDSSLPSELVELIDALLLDSDAADLPRADLLEAVREHPAAARLPFYPGEPGVPVNDPPTAGLRSVTAALHDAPDQTIGQSGSAKPPEEGIVDTAIAALRGQTGRTRTNRGAQAPRRRRRKKNGNTQHRCQKRKEPSAGALDGKSRSGVRAGAVAVVALVSVASGAALIIGGAQSDRTVATAAADRAESGEEPRRPKTEEDPSARSTAKSREGKRTVTEPEYSEPCQKFTELTHARAAAFAAGRPADLAGLTVPGSNAAEADVEAADKPAEPMDVTMNVTECDVEDSTPEAATIRAVVSAEAGGQPVPEARIRVNLEKHDGKWKVSRTEELHDH